MPRSDGRGAGPRRRGRQARAGAPGRRALGGDLTLLLWVVLVVAGIGAMQRGASRTSAALDAHRGRAGLGGVAAGALLGIATAAPEVSVNLAGVALGWPDLGLGAALGSNVPALPLIVLLAALTLPPG